MYWAACRHWLDANQQIADRRATESRDASKRVGG